ncbi:MAG TPA: YcxB family protein [Telluria sp.]|nr:YcxB family protein [Telluria sp.]
MNDSVTVDLSKTDILAFHLYMFPRLPGNWVFLAVLFVGLFGFLVLADRPTESRAYPIAALASGIGALLGWIGGLLMNFLSLSRRIDRTPGILGLHRFTLETDGLHERTDAEETIYEWTSVSAVRKTPSFIIVSVNRKHHILMPRRAFDSDRAFDDFYRRIEALLRERRASTG